MDPQTFDALQLELECKGVSADGRLIRVPGDEPDDIELAQIARYSNGVTRVSLREDVEAGIAKTIATIDPTRAFERPDTLAAVFGDERVAWYRMKSYVFPADLSRPLEVLRMMPDVERPEDSELSAGRTLFAVVVDGERASYCCSSRENDSAAEAWVETFPEFRRRGYASRSVTAWACSVRDAGKTAFYSHRDDNLASAGLARTLGLVPWLSLVNFEIAERAGADDNAP